MVLAVIQDIIILAAYSRDDGQVCLETRGYGHRLFIARESSYLALELQMQVKRSVQETASANTRTVLIQRSVTCSDNCLVLCETEIVITAQHDHAVVLHLHDWCLTALQLVEIGINS